MFCSFVRTEKRQCRVVDCVLTPVIILACIAVFIVVNLSCSSTTAPRRLMVPTEIVCQGFSVGSRSSLSERTLSWAHLLPRKTFALFLEPLTLEDCSDSMLLLIGLLIKTRLWLQTGENGTVVTDSMLNPHQSSIQASSLKASLALSIVS